MVRNPRKLGVCPWLRLKAGTRPVALADSRSGPAPGQKPDQDCTCGCLSVFCFPFRRTFGRCSGGSGSPP